MGNIMYLLINHVILFIKHFMITRIFATMLHRVADINMYIHKYSYINIACKFSFFVCLALLIITKIVNMITSKYKKKIYYR